ncbi:hypothetical protein RF11_10075 [Thelohanellus kitauei]|uniref:Alpha-soluble NSF attachment protein n=1 Tax=Thelohanellus kitauei TaxID=669202 RepID=A0A0C2MZI4_THEKT|nr:hypothetical protein RF11_10075 [Thelohanellus kitauei]
MNKFVDDIQVLVDNADALYLTGEFEKAANTYYEAAELAISFQLQYLSKVSLYLAAAKSYIDINDIRGDECLEKAVDVCTTDGKIDKAIEICFDIGHKLLVEFEDQVRAEKLFIKGDELRLQRERPHSCVLTEFEEKDFYGDLKKAFEFRQKFQVTETLSDGTTTTHECNSSDNCLALCRICVSARTGLDKFLKDGTEEREPLLYRTKTATQKE